MCVEACIPEPPAQVCGIANPDDKEPVGMLCAAARVAEIRNAAMKRQGFRPATRGPEGIGTQAPRQQTREGAAGPATDFSEQFQSSETACSAVSHGIVGPAQQAARGA